MLKLERYRPTKNIFCSVGIFPISDHFYEPLFNPAHLRKSLREDRHLPGIDFNVDEQLRLLGSFDYNREIETIPLENPSGLRFYMHNGNFESGDAEYYYNLVRLIKPSTIIEIGSGFSTLVALLAIEKNMTEANRDTCEFICIEPYRADWIKGMKHITVKESKVEEIGLETFTCLRANDILFIDSSHMIRPQGDVLFEYLEILPTLNSGVYVHSHDIFTPKDYPDEWVLRDSKFWNEQYMLEAFLTNNASFRIVGALNYLKHHHFTELSSKCPVLAREPYREPGSFWFVKQ
ncbi:MAG: class I SAM-dependent methyltransferase [Nitrospirota bacterium]